jgi:hypothetical protein
MINHKPLPPLDRLKKYLYLDESSPSGLRWADAKKKGVVPHSVAGKPNSNGYWAVGFDLDRYLAHRLVFFMQTGIDPGPNTVDHVKGLDFPLDLRLATYGENSANSRKPSTGICSNTTSKYKGVHWDKKAQKWSATICRKHKIKFLGYFDSETEAAEKYNSAAFKESGEFARLNEIE